MARALPSAGCEQPSALPHSGDLGRLSSVLKGHLFLRPARLLRAWREERRYRDAVNELYGLDDRMLQDIGITRGEIMRVARSGREIV